MSLGKQAKLIGSRQESVVLNHLSTTRHPERNRVMFLLSVKTGLRAKEIASVSWGMLTDPRGKVDDELALEDKASKGRSGRRIPLHKTVRDALVVLQTARGSRVKPDAPVIYSERGAGMSAASVVNWFSDLFNTLGMHGCTSHSGRRTFVTATARKIVQAGGSLRDVQQLVGHSDLSTTQSYIEGSSDAKRRVIDLL